MEEIVPGHKYLLKNLKSNSLSMLQFHQSSEIHEEPVDGPSTQEVLRACIERVKHLDSEIPWKGNEDILFHLRSAIALFEHRALLRKIEKGFDIEHMSVRKDGHII